MYVHTRVKCMYFEGNLFMFHWESFFPIRNLTCCFVSLVRFLARFMSCCLVKVLFLGCTKPGDFFFFSFRFDILRKKWKVKIAFQSASGCVLKSHSFWNTGQDCNKWTWTSTESWFSSPFIMASLTRCWELRVPALALATGIHSSFGH